MAYCVYTDLLQDISEDQVVQLTDDDNTGSVDQAKITAAINDADAEIDSCAGGRYIVPFSPVPGIIKKKSVDIAIYFLFKRRSVKDETRKETYDEAMKWLGKLSKGLVQPDGSTSLVETEKGDGTIVIDSNPRVFNRTKMKGF